VPLSSLSIQLSGGYEDPMKCRLALVAVTLMLLSSIPLFAQRRSSRGFGDAPFTEAPADVAFWVAYWGNPRVVLFGTEEEAFNQNVHEIMFPLNVYDQPVNPNILDEDVAWLKEHAGDRFYIEGYASSDGLLGYNLTLSNRRADWVKQALISKGIAENRIVLGSPWGQLYPTCAELDEACWSKNRVVRFTYSPH
jgi:outer membrane protein OmpA-like peptidoglycan-associated protein